MQATINVFNRLWPEKNSNHSCWTGCSANQNSVKQHSKGPEWAEQEEEQLQLQIVILCKTWLVLF